MGRHALDDAGEDVIAAKVLKIISNRRFNQLTGDADIGRGHSDRRVGKGGRDAACLCRLEATM